MSKILLSAAAIAVAALTTSGACAKGGGPQDPEDSPYAFFETQTVHPELFTPSATFERRSAFTDEYGAVQPRGEVIHARRGHRSHHWAPVQE